MRFKEPGCSSPLLIQSVWDACGSVFYGLAFGGFQLGIMSGRGDPSELSGIESHQGDFDHPRGTLAVLIIFGVLFMLAWLATYLFVFLERGAPHS
jgi:hypothetical protein